MIPFPKIRQYRDALHEIKRRASFQGLDDQGEPIIREPAEWPVVEFVGTVKLHGTNASVVDDDGERRYQSRNRVITPDDDNAGFAGWAEGVDWRPMLDELRREAATADELPVVIYGEWCGQGIQTTVAVSMLPRRFVVFGARVGDDWLDVSALPSIHSEVEVITDAPVYRLTVDVCRPEAAQTEAAELTQAVEALCPYSALHGVEGMGEGIVWQSVTPEYEGIRFKTKGEKHSKSKVKTLSPADVEQADALRALAASLMTDDRLEQGIAYLDEMGLSHGRESTGAFLKYVVTDCIAEERLAIEGAGYKAKLIGRPLSEIAKRWFFAREAVAA